MSKPRRWMFLHPNDGTVPYPSTEDNSLLWERISELEGTIERQHTRIDELNQQLQQHQGRITVGQYQDVRDEQRIDRYVAQQFTDRNDFFIHLRRQQATRIVEKLLEENLIDHTFRPDEPNGDYVSRMDLRVVRNNSE
jgi:uncharacterized coiled-coil protein SlyX